MKEHPNEKQLLDFLKRPDQSADYVRKTVVWLKEEYPGSVQKLLPILREIYREKINRLHGRPAGGGV